MRIRLSKFLCSVLLLSTVGAILLATPASAAGTSWRTRADAAYTALQKYFYADGFYREKYPVQDGDNPYSFAWTLREAAANLDLHREMSAPFTALESYWDTARTPPGYDSYPGGGDLFYDDNSVIGLELVRRYLLTGDRVMLHRAERVFPVVVSGWDTDPTHPCAGGLHWTQAGWNTIKATNATGLAAELAAHLYELTRSPSYLTWAERLYQWNRTCTRASDGLYYNSIDFQGTVDKTLWIYNSGSMIGAATLLFRATGDAGYLRRARADAAGAAAYWTAERTYDQPAIFDAIYFKNLLLLDSIAPNPAYRQAMSAYAEQIWQHNRDPETGLFRFQPSGGGAYDPAARAETLEQSAAVQVFALLSWNPRDYRFSA
ncbi:MAG TPA: glycoside hydrolase family 76 protein [Mycobacteriales bacterium]|nr:glycoside hydrolase family 76 protein [Mycobacteriales bacterium]